MITYKKVPNDGTPYVAARSGKLDIGYYYVQGFIDDLEIFHGRWCVYLNDEFDPAQRSVIGGIHGGGNRYVKPGWFFPTEAKARAKIERELKAWCKARGLRVAK